MASKSHSKTPIVPGFVVDDDATLEGLIDWAFDYILDIMLQQRLCQASPKFFVVYAHDNDTVPEFPAHAATVQKFIGWFKKLQFDVTSDKSPHGESYGRELENPGACRSILTNQLSLLPREWDNRNVDYALIFGSPLLGKYVRDEEEAVRRGDIKKSYLQVISEACGDCSTMSIPGERFHQVREKISHVQKDFSESMGSSFHHVLTELGVMSFRQSQEAVSSTIPVALGDLGESCFPQSVVPKNDTTLRVDVNLTLPHLSFFKILLMFEGELEQERALIEGLEESFKRCVDHLEQGFGVETPSQSQEKLHRIILEMLGPLTKAMPHRGVGQRQVTRPAIRKILNDHASLFRPIERISQQKLPSSVEDIGLEIIAAYVATASNRKVVKMDPPRQVPLRELFNDVQVENGGSITPQRILIQGPPGVGKSTLSRRLMYDYGCGKDLCSKFALVLQIPLRMLKRPGTLKDLLFAEYFSREQGGSAYSDRLHDLILEQRSKQDQEGRQTSRNDKILLILDGLEDVAGLQQDHHNYQVLKHLLQQPNVIIMSRYGIDSNSVLMEGFDLEVAAVGLNNKNISSYLANAEIVPVDDGPEIIRFIRSNRVVNNMVKIPLYLDMLCYSWDECRRQKASKRRASLEPEEEATNALLPTTTEMYEAIVEKLWRKDIPVFGKINNGEPVTAEIVRAENNFRNLLPIIQPEAAALERIAAFLTKQGGLEFDMDDIDKANTMGREECDVPDPVSLKKNLRLTSFLRRAPNGTDSQMISFVHTTFQDFFMAQYISKSEDRIKTYLADHKYERRFQPIWQFVAGLLSSQPAKLGNFFESLDEEPRDLIGDTHARLVMHCFSESRGFIEKDLRTRISGELSDWLDLELRIQRRPTIGAMAAFPEDIILRKLKELPGSRNHVYLELMLSVRSNLSDSTCDELLALFRRNRSWSPQVRRILSAQLSLPSNLLNALLHMWDKGDKDEVAFARHVLVWQASSLPESHLESLADDFVNTPGGEECSQLDRRVDTYRILQAQDPLPVNIRDKLIAYLENNPATLIEQLEQCSISLTPNSHIRDVVKFPFVAGLGILTERHALVPETAGQVCRLIGESGSQPKKALKLIQTLLAKQDLMDHVYEMDPAAMSDAIAWLGAMLFASGEESAKNTHPAQQTVATSGSAQGQQPATRDFVHPRANVSATHIFRFLMSLSGGEFEALPKLISGCGQPVPTAMELVAKTQNPDLSTEVRRMAAALLVSMPNLPVRHLRKALELAKDDPGTSKHIFMMWQCHDIDSLCSIADSLSPDEITVFLEKFYLVQTLTQSRPIWILNRTVHYYSYDWEKKDYELKKDSRFRKNFCTAQKGAGVPKNARVLVKSKTLAQRLSSALGGPEPLGRMEQRRVGNRRVGLVKKLGFKG